MSDTYTQRSFDAVALQPSLFTADERDELADIAAQATDADRRALTELVRWART